MLSNFVEEMGYLYQRHLAVVWLHPVITAQIQIEIHTAVELQASCGHCLLYNVTHWGKKGGGQSRWKDQELTGQYIAQWSFYQSVFFLGTSVLSYSVHSPF